MGNRGFEIDVWLELGQVHCITAYSFPLEKSLFPNGERLGLRFVHPIPAANTSKPLIIFDKGL